MEIQNITGAGSFPERPQTNHRIESEPAASTQNSQLPEPENIVSSGEAHLDVYA